MVGSEEHGLSYLMRRACDLVVRILIASSTESLNAGVAARIALYAGRPPSGYSMMSGTSYAIAST